MKLYIYTIKATSNASSWDDAIANNEVEVVATIEGESQNAIDAAAEDRFSDTDTYGWTYADDLPDADDVERIEA